MNCKVKSAAEQSDHVLIRKSCKASAMALCAALNEAFLYDPNGRCARFAVLLRERYGKYKTECKGTRYKTQIRAMGEKIAEDADKEGFQYKMRFSRDEGVDVQDFLFIAAVLVLHDSFGVRIRGRKRGEASEDVKRFFKAYNDATARWNHFNREVKEDMKQHPDEAEEYRIDMLEWMQDRLRGTGMTEETLNEKVLRW